MTRIIYTLEQFHGNKYVEIAAGLNRDSMLHNMRVARLKEPSLPVRIVEKPETESTVWNGAKK